MEGNRFGSSFGWTFTRTLYIERSHSETLRLVSSTPLDFRLYQKGPVRDTTLDPAFFSLTC